MLRTPPGDARTEARGSSQSDGCGLRQSLGRGVRPSHPRATPGGGPKGRASPLPPAAHPAGPREGRWGGRGRPQARLGPRPRDRRAGRGKRRWGGGVSRRGGFKGNPRPRAPLSPAACQAPGLGAGRQRRHQANPAPGCPRGSSAPPAPPARAAARPRPPARHPVRSRPLGICACVGGRTCPVSSLDSAETGRKFDFSRSPYGRGAVGGDGVAPSYPTRRYRLVPEGGGSGTAP